MTHASSTISLRYLVGCWLKDAFGWGNSVVFGKWGDFFSYNNWGSGWVWWLLWKSFEGCFQQNDPLISRQCAGSRSNLTFWGALKKPLARWSTWSLGYYMFKPDFCWESCLKDHDGRISAGSWNWSQRSSFYIGIDSTHMVVSKNRGTPKWMVYNGKPY